LDDSDYEDDAPLSPALPTADLPPEPEAESPVSRNVAGTPFAAVLSELGGDDFSSLLSGASLVAGWQWAFLDASVPIEQEQAISWFASLCRLIRPGPGVSWEEAMVEKSRAVIRRHRFMFAGGNVHVARIIVNGPRQSGKSTFLSVLGREFLIDLLACGEWKETFVFALDVAVIAPLLTDPGALFKVIARQTFRALAAQYPLFLPYAEGVTAAFEGVTIGVPLLPKAFVVSDDFRPVVQEVKKLLAMLSACWNDATALEPWLVNTFTLPSVIATIFGYTKLFFVVDHMDMAHVALAPASPFDEAETNIFVIELVKLMVSTASFVASSKDGRQLLKMLGPISDARGVDLSEGTTIISTLDLVKIPADTGKEFLVTFEEEEPQITFNVHHFGGCPGLLQTWVEINQSADRLDEAVQNAGDVEEARLFLQGLVEAALPRLFTTVEGDPLTKTVKSVVRIGTKV
jgi:hypothetical protein